MKRDYDNPYQNIPGVHYEGRCFDRGYRLGFTESRKENEALRELLERAKSLVEFSHDNGTPIHAKKWLSDYEKIKAGKE